MISWWLWSHFAKPHVGHTVFWICELSKLEDHVAWMSECSRNICCMWCASAHRDMSHEHITDTAIWRAQQVYRSQQYMTQVIGSVVYAHLLRPDMNLWAKKQRSDSVRWNPQSQASCGRERIQYQSDGWPCWPRMKPHELRLPMPVLLTVHVS